MLYRPRESSIIFYDQSPCPYFEDGRISTVEYIYPDEDDMLRFHEYLANGYRRLGRVFYRNVCKNCEECRPLRIKVEDFKPSRSDRRTLRKNHDVRIETVSPPFITPEKIHLYDSYIASKHEKDRSEVIDNTISILFSMHYGFHQIIEMNYFAGDKLMAVGIVDEGQDSLSSNYCYYDTEYLGQRPGIFSVTQEISLAVSRGKKYYYLGFYIEKNQKMSYKKDFRPNQILVNGKWKDFSSK